VIGEPMVEAQELNDTPSPLGGPLVLRHASKRSDGPWGNPDDWDVIDADGRDIGRIFRPGAGVPQERPWMWTITGAVVASRLPSHGFAATKDEAKAAFAETWRAGGRHVRS